MSSEDDKKPGSRRPEDNPFKQQKLKAWQPILTPKWVIGTFVVIGIIFIPVGIILKKASDEVVEYVAYYDGGVSSGSPHIIDDAAKCKLKDLSVANTFSDEHTCRVHFKVTQDMKAPVYVYYQLENFYQNHRRYVQSKNDGNLNGLSYDASGCEGSADVMSPAVDKRGVVIGAAAVRRPYPCGLIANSFFNDIFWLQNASLQMTESGIAWPSDLTKKFENPAELRTSSEDGVPYLYLWNNPNYSRIIPGIENDPAVPNVTAWTAPTKAYGVQNEHFIVWMRTAGLPSFRKLYGIINQDIPKDTTISFRVSSNFVVQTYDGTKALVLSTTSWLGGKNPFLGVAYIVVGVACLLLALVFFVKHKLSPRKLGDTRYLVWKNSQ